MTGIFGNLATDGLEQAQDNLGGFQAFDSDIYESTIKLAYAGQSAGGAMSVTLVADFGGREYKETVYVTNRAGENFFLNKNDKTKKVPLPGFTIINDLCIVTTEKPLKDQTTEEKVVNVYDPDLKKEAPKSVQVLTELLGKPVYLAVVNSLENKSEKVGDEYKPTADTRTVNYIDKVFHHPSKVTVVEATNNQAPTFFDKWAERNRGQVRDKRTIKDGQTGSTGSAGAPKASGVASAAPRTSLFGAKA